MKVINLSATPRARAGKGTARQTRREGLTPAVIYGSGKAPTTISIDSNTLTVLIHRPGFFSHMYDIAVEGGAVEKCLARDFQLDPVTDRVLHVDFLRASAETTVHVQVPVEFINADASAGIKVGGVLNVVAHEVELTCHADSIPEHLTIDLTGLEIGDSIHLSNVKLPDGVKPTHHDDVTIATIVPPTVSKEVAAPAAAAAPAAS